MIAAIAEPRRVAGTFGDPFRDVDRSAGELEKMECLSRPDFEVFVRDYAERLLAVARRMLRCEEDAADAVQDAFCSALVARRTFQGESTVYTWLYRIVVNVCLMKIRSQPRATLVSLDELSYSSEPENCQRLRFSTRGQLGDCYLEREELRAIVRSCIEQLPDKYREVLLLRDIEQLDTDRTAELLDLSPGAVKTRLHRARQALRVMLVTGCGELHPRC